MRISYRASAAIERENASHHGEPLRIVARNTDGRLSIDMFFDAYLDTQDEKLTTPHGGVVLLDPTSKALLESQTLDFRRSRFDVVPTTHVRTAIDGLCRVLRKHEAGQ